MKDLASRNILLKIAPVKSRTAYVVLDFLCSQRTGAFNLEER